MQAQSAERSAILHLFTPTKQASPFDVNMAVDAGYQVVVPYPEVDMRNVAALTQDAIFSRGPKGVRKTGIFIGGRDVVVAQDMLELAQKSMFPPFMVSAFADPSGSFTTAAGMIACVERELRKAHGSTLDGKRVLILGGTGAVGRIAAVLCARSGAAVRLCSHSDQKRAEAAAEQLNKRFDVAVEGLLIDAPATLRRELGGTDVVLATAAAGVQVMGGDDLAAADGLLVAADVNAVPPAGIAGVDVKHDGVPIPGSSAVGIGALAIGNVKYQVQHQLFVRMLQADKAVFLGFSEALEMARELVGGEAE
ncbi:MAG TPA: NAD(P)-dependent methylenetetrahydromethanopterin dehydrogenase [Lautropia sp.]|jgi:methylene-tetrahydromethanopterin dehydrogenase|nr:NAD(P)-dependent methylenetetrahydromethanopterin dehydrogenase [Lautropia sp.]